MVYSQASACFKKFASRPEIIHRDRLRLSVILLDLRGVLVTRTSWRCTALPSAWATNGVMAKGKSTTV